MSAQSPEHELPASPPLAQQMPNQSSSVSHCWVCQGEATTSSSSDGAAAAVVVPHPVCACRGSLGTVHQRCIDEWVLVHQKPVCPSCGETYKIVEVRARSLFCTARSDQHIDDAEAAPASSSEQKSVASLERMRGRRLDDDIPRISDVLHYYGFITFPQWRRQQPVLLSSTSSSLSSSVASSSSSTWSADNTTTQANRRTLTLENVLLIWRFLVTPLLRRVTWWVMLFSWYWVAAPILYGRVYFFGLSYLFPPSSSGAANITTTSFESSLPTGTASTSGRNSTTTTTIKDIANAALGASLSSYLCNDVPPERSVVWSRMEEYQLGLEVIVVGLISACVFRGIISSYYRWLEFLKDGRGGVAGRQGQAAAGGEEDAHNDDAQAGAEEDDQHRHNHNNNNAREDPVDDATHVFTSIDRIHAALSWLLWNTVEWEVAAPTSEDLIDSEEEVVLEGTTTDTDVSPTTDGSTPTTTTTTSGRDGGTDHSDDDVIDLIWSHRRVESLQHHLQALATEFLVVSLFLTVFGYPNGGQKFIAAVCVCGAIIWRWNKPLRVVRDPLRRLSETFERRGEADTQKEKTLMFVTYMFDMLFFSILLPVCGGYVVHLALGPQLVQWPDVMEYLVFGLQDVNATANATITATTASSTTYFNTTLSSSSSSSLSAFESYLLTTSSTAAAVALDSHHSCSLPFSMGCRILFACLRLKDVLLYLVLYMPNSELPSVLSVLLHWFTGTLCLMTLVRYESSVMVPMFHPGVDLFFIRSVDVSDELAAEIPDFTLKFVLSQVFDADPLRVMRDFVRVLAIESVALGGFIAFPVQTLFYLLAIVSTMFPSVVDDEGAVSLQHDAILTPLSSPISLNSSGWAALPTDVASEFEVSRIIQQLDEIDMMSPLRDVHVSQESQQGYRRRRPQRLISDGGHTHRPFGLCVVDDEALPPSPADMDAIKAMIKSSSNYEAQRRALEVVMRLCSGSANHDFSSKNPYERLSQCFVALSFESMRSCLGEEEDSRESSPPSLATTKSTTTAHQRVQPVPTKPLHHRLSARFTVLYGWLLLTFVVALCAYPMQRLQLRLLLPPVMAIGGWSWLSLRERIHTKDCLNVLLPCRSSRREAASAKRKIVANLLHRRQQRRNQQQLHINGHRLYQQSRIITVCPRGLPCSTAGFC
ncbi:zinc finger protein, putative [Bodo saltans]|uniref:Zinc finger protein, putative n=1 Tax=Bodo saltans TaxID=75058 RepID=A0A0S4JEF2_BODSA|nr:zinc finger protein, putative [Bodo saltans]|eukprot:CUG88353.1 zinc finger protein, putative [Bodo saltans]